MEIIQLSGYAEFKKLNIAVKYLVPRQLEDTGLKAYDIEITENAITVVHHYTQESGVRNLEREIGSVCRKIARGAQAGARPARPRRSAWSPSRSPSSSGRPSTPATGPARRDRPRNGLAYMTYGGAILECEVTVVAGKGKLVITGLLEKGMQESARSRRRLHPLATSPAWKKTSTKGRHPHSLPRVRAQGRPERRHHLATSIASALMKIPVRKNVAMTGEIALRSRA